MDADELYALAPEDFTAARDAAAKAARADGDAEAARALKALRRPSVSAWLVNRLATERAELLDQLLALGPALAQAQAAGAADDLRALGQQRRALVEAVADAAAAAAGRAVSGSVREELTGTLEAALSDPASAQAVRSGRLVRALSYAGFGGVDLAGAVAEPTTGTADTSTPAKRSKKDGRSKAGPSEAERAAAREAVASAERAAHDAAGHLDDAVRAAERAERQRAGASAALEAADQAVSQARAALAAAEQEREAAARAEQAAEQGAAQAVEAVRVAQDEAEAARDELDRLRRAAG